jgi:clan AA aspartic protease (TIGR02281 family)
MYQHGLGVTQDYDEAKKLYLLAAKQGDLSAINNLGVMYGNGFGVTPDHKEAMKWFRLAAEKGDAMGQINLGNSYRDGLAVTQDLTRAYMWYDLATSRPNSPTRTKMTSKQMAAKHREEIRYKMTVSQIAHARAAAKECLDSLFRNCGLIDVGFPTFPTESSMSISIRMKKEGGTYVVPVLINNAITLDFVLDSGASVVSVPADVFRTLVRTGSIKETDITGKQTYVLADGSKLEAPTFIIRSLKVGDTFVQNVRGSVASPEGTLLLGQSFLERFKSWSIDNSNHELLLKP